MDYRAWVFNYQLRYDRKATQYAPELNPYEIDEIFRRAIDAFMRENLKVQKGKGFELNDEQRQKLSTLVVTAPEQGAVAPTSITNGVYEFTLSSPPFVHPIYIPIRGRVLAQKEGCTDKYIDLFFEEHDDLNYILGSELDKPSFAYGRSVAVEAKSSSALGSKSLYVHTGGDFNIALLELTYIKRPVYPNSGGYVDATGVTTVFTNSDLPEEVHNEVIDKAVEIAMFITGDPMVQQSTYQWKDNQ